MVIIPGISDLSESPKDQDIDQFAIMQVTDDDGRQVTLLVKRASNALEICQELLKKFNREESVENFSLSCIYNNEGYFLFFLFLFLSLIIQLKLFE